MSAKLDTPAALPAVHELSRAVDRILHSREFHGSETLRGLLSFLCSCALEQRADPPGAREIAKAVFGREDFDSQNDSVVRVHTGRLRAKLAEYYMAEGVEDDIVVFIPKGSYKLLWTHRHRTSAVSPPSPLDPTLPSPLPVPARGNFFSRLRSLSLPLPVALLLLAAALLAWLLFPRLPAAKPGARALTTFWRGFLSGEPPLVVFSNFRFLGLPDGSLQTIKGANSSDLPVIDTYTTVGEVMGVFEVSKTLSSFNGTARVKRSRLLTWDEAKDSSLVFIGGPLAETPLRDVQLLRYFRFLERSAGTSGAIANLHPGSGEQPIYSVSTPYPDIHRTQSLTDFAIVALRPGLSARHSILILAGITEFGTQGAAEFVASNDRLEELLARLAVPVGTPAMTPFEALLEVRVEGGVPLATSIRAVHKLPAEQ
jgi:hypothetical protein